MNSQISRVSRVSRNSRISKRAVKNEENKQIDYIQLPDESFNNLSCLDFGVAPDRFADFYFKQQQ